MCENKPAPAAPNDQVYQKLIVPPEKKKAAGGIFMELLKPPFKPLTTSQPEFQGTHQVPGSPRLQPPLGMEPSFRVREVFSVEIPGC
jgi:hypothetical protein